MPLLVINSICRGQCSLALNDAAYSTCRITCKPYKGDNCLLRMGMPLLVEAPGAGLSSFFCYLRYLNINGTEPPDSKRNDYPDNSIPIKSRERDSASFHSAQFTAKCKTPITQH